MVVPKFRAWDTFDEDMVNDIFFSWQDCGYESLNECLSDERWKFMQFTGVFDKNGKEIFEGDVVRMHSGELLPVKLHHGMFEPVCYYISNAFERVGSVFENPELLEHPDFREVNND
ncbi:YopX family protein [Streptococcus suis]|uniref:YopX family protein n=1 Tax=Streptococcus suis TaxID=1307 RepID=UPI0013752153|nr:YopX family protein [Streptococcus suis]MBY5027555.1 YopX family protein [Streptococcus suis]